MIRPGPHTLHPADRALLKPLTSLGKPNAANNSVSFLRRTEYNSGQNTQHFSSSTSKDLLRMRNDAKRRRASLNKEDPINIMRKIVKGFDTAYPSDAYKGEDSTTNLRGVQATDAELKAWTNPRHPTNPDLKLLDSYPILPDLDALPSTGFYVVMKFINNPVAAGERYDDRLDAAILQPIMDAQSTARFEQKMAEWDPSSSRPEPIPEYDYNYFLPSTTSAVRGLKRKYDVNDPENDDPELYTDDLGDGSRAFKYSRLRTYETYSQQGDHQHYYHDSVALALHDPEASAGDIAPGTRKRLKKGAYFYPIVQRTALRPKRNLGRMGVASQSEEAKIDELNVTIIDMNEEVRSQHLEKRAALDPPMDVGEVA